MMVNTLWSQERFSAWQRMLNVSLNISGKVDCLAENVECIFEYSWKVDSFAENVSGKSQERFKCSLKDCWVELFLLAGWRWCLICIASSSLMSSVVLGRSAFEVGSLHIKSNKRYLKSIKPSKYKVFIKIHNSKIKLVNGSCISSSVFYMTLLPGKL